MPTNISIPNTFTSGTTAESAEVNANFNAVTTYLNTTGVGTYQGLSVTDAALAAGAVITAKIADLAVTTGKLNDLAVTAGKIAADAVTTAKILDANVTEAKIAADAVTTAKIADANVTTAKLADGAVTNDKMADDAFGAWRLAATGSFRGTNSLSANTQYAALINTHGVLLSANQQDAGVETGANNIHGLFRLDRDLLRGDSSRDVEVKLRARVTTNGTAANCDLTMRLRPVSTILNGGATWGTTLATCEVNAGSVLAANALYSDESTAVTLPAASWYTVTFEFTTPGCAASSIVSGGFEILVREQ